MDGVCEPPGISKARYPPSGKTCWYTQWTSVPKDHTVKACLPCYPESTHRLFRLAPAESTEVHLGQLSVAVTQRCAIGIEKGDETLAAIELA